MKITVKATQEYFYKEMSGMKPNTIRLQPRTEGDYSTHDTIEVIECHPDGKIIEGGRRFTRTISDISFWNGNMIISWKHEENEKDVK